MDFFGGITNVEGMQLSRFTDLGLRALMRLAVGDGAEERVTVKLIARQVNASENYVAKAVSASPSSATWNPSAAARAGSS